MASQDKGRNENSRYLNGAPPKERLSKNSQLIHGSAPKARPDTVWPSGKPPGGKIEVKRQPDGSLSFKPVED